MFFEDARCYVCLAFAPKSKGHTIVAWKEHATDLNDLNDEEYHHLMAVIRRVRLALGRVYPSSLVYMNYWNEEGREGDSRAQRASPLLHTLIVFI